MGKKGVKTTKLPLGVQTIERLKNKALILGEEGGRANIDTKKSFLLFRYTGMHPSVIYTYDYEKKKNTDSNLTEGKDDKGNITIEWDRPKKEGGWSHTVIVKHPDIDFDVETFYKEVNDRKSRFLRSRNYATWLMKQLGDSIDVRGVSPLSFRHTLAVEFLKAKFPQSVVCQILNISPATLRRYGKFVTEDRNDMVAEHWGMK